MTQRFLSIASTAVFVFCPLQTNYLTMLAKFPFNFVIVLCLLLKMKCNIINCLLDLMMIMIKLFSTVCARESNEKMYSTSRTGSSAGARKLELNLWTHTQKKVLSVAGSATALLHLFISNDDLQKCTQSFLICSVYPVMNMNEGMNIDERWWWGMNIDEGFSSLQLMALRAQSGTNQSSCSQHMNDRHLFFLCFFALCTAELSEVHD